MFFQPSTREHPPQLQISERKLLLAIGDVGACFVAIVIALRIWASVARYPFTMEFILAQWGWFLFLPTLWVILARANDFYDLRIAANRNHTLQHLLMVTAQLILVYLVVFFVSSRDALPRLFIIYYAIASFLLVGIWRFARPVLLGWVNHPRRTLVVGSDWAAETIITLIQSVASEDYEVRGIIDRNATVGVTVANIPVIGSGDDLMNFVMRDSIREIIVTNTNNLSGTTFQAVMDAYEHGVQIVPMPILYERITGRTPVEFVNDDWAVVFLPIKNNDEIFDPYPLIKRAMDIALGLVGFLVFAITFPILYLIIRLDSQGDTFYSQDRTGKNGKVFRIIKYRSMVSDAESGTGAVFSQAGDPRVTRVGRFMRKTRLDELPQVINVLKGEMSVVGPRPERPEHIQRLTKKIPFYRTRMIVKPGLTGWAQVRYGYGANDDDALVKLQYDLYYIRHQSLLLDINIILRTVGKVLSMSGV